MIKVEALHSLGHHISQGLHRCLGMEKFIVAEASLLIGAFLVKGLDISVCVWAVLDGFSAGFLVLVLKVRCCRVFSYIFTLASQQA